jgi:hypothetical protein
MRELKNKDDLQAIQYQTKIANHFREQDKKLIKLPNMFANTMKELTKSEK